MIKIFGLLLISTIACVYAEEELLCRVCIGLLSRGAVDKPQFKDSFGEWLEEQVALLQGGDINGADGEDLWPIFNQKKTELELLIASPGSQYDDFRKNCGTFQFCPF